MANDALDSADGGVEQALERIERAVDRLEVVARRVSETAPAAIGELTTRHRKLKDKVASELRQLDLLLANLPQ
ncbi:hypothetical protein [Novosphingobium sp. Chol11]|uniref:hypothetical protein n=1 Tax=Novosphingobium sp. Chol11 TaxID=1385763 RepID=UPI0025F98839|nr:hypothetical protein [Novosphingobium sp. Chol11]